MTKNYMSCLVAAVYATSSVIDSVRRAQEQNSRNLLERATQVCRSKLVSHRLRVVSITHRSCTLSSTGFCIGRSGNGHRRWGSKGDDMPVRGTNASRPPCGGESRSK